MKIWQFIIFLTIFSMVLFSLHYYVLFRILKFFSVNRYIWLIALLLAFFYPLAAFIDRMLHSLVTRVIYYIASAWLGFVFFLFFTLLIFELVNLAYPIFSKPIFGYVILGIVGLITLFSLINAVGVDVKEVNIDNFGKELKIVQMSDVHVGTIRNSKFLQSLVDKTNSLNPDFVFVTGDLIDGSGKLSNITFATIKKLNVPVYFVMGNHEFYEGEDKVENYLDNNHIVVLRDEVVSVNGVNIIGVEYSSDKDYFKKVLSKIDFDKNLPTIVLNHEPKGYLDAKEAGAKLQLSGHTHAGQIFPFTLFVKLAYPRISGLYTYDDFNLYVSPGTGTWGPPMRLGSRNEITVFNLS